MNKPLKLGNKPVIYQSRSGAMELRGDFEHGSVWATQEQIATIFEIERSVATKHIRNILKDKELDADTVCAKFAHTGSDGKVYQVQFYNLDIILAVGYRTNSKKAITFRGWATKILHGYIVGGFAVNRSRIAKNYDAFLQAVADVKALLPVGMIIDNADVLELIKLFSETWLSLGAYDKDALIAAGTKKKTVRVTAEGLAKAVAALKSSLLKSGEATDLFATERDRDSISGIVGNVMQSFDKKDLYPTIEEKAAHLLYFIVKNHPFLDGNKRSGAYAFIWFLNRAGVLNASRMTPTALTALTLLIAESAPAQKDKMVRLVMNLIRP
jgi:prophage maintenance system killer protein